MKRTAILIKEQHGGYAEFIFQHRTFMGESAKTIEAMGVAEPRIVDAAVRQIVMPELYDRRLDACSARTRSARARSFAKT